MSEPGGQNTMPVDGKHILIESFAKFIAERDEGRIIVMVAGGMYTGIVADHNLLEEILAKGVERAQAQTEGEREARPVPAFVEGGHTIELRDVEFIPYGAPSVRYHFSQVFVFSDEVTAITTMTTKSFPGATA